MSDSVLLKGFGILALGCLLIWAGFGWLGAGVGIVGWLWMECKRAIREA